VASYWPPPSPTPTAIKRHALGAALAYAAAGWYVLPINRATKDAGSVLHRGWPAKTSRDPDVLASWFAGTDHGLALHVGRSGAVAFDVDNPAALPDWIADLLRPAPFQSTRLTEPGRGHYVFAVPPGRSFRNSNGKLGKTWGEIRGRNGIVVVEPTEHSKPGGRYLWTSSGTLPMLPEALADRLVEHSGTDEDAATDAEVKLWLASHPIGMQPGRVKPILARCAAESAGSRHVALTSCLPWLCKEVNAGHLAAPEALRELKSAHMAALADPTHRNGADPGRKDFHGVLAWAVAQAANDPLVDGMTNGSATTIGAVAGAAEKAGAAESAATPSEAGGAGSWTPLDLSAILDGTAPVERPTLMPRTDGVGLLYPGRVHSFHGEPESGKSFLAQAETARLLMAGQDVAYLDYESDAVSVIGRLVAMGATGDQIKAHLTYLRPEVDPAVEPAAFALLLRQRFALVVIDGVTEALATSAVSSRDNDEITRWSRDIPKRIAEATGAAVLLIDHVIKSEDGRGRFAIGAQAKMSVLTGAAYMVEVVRPLGRGLAGVLQLRVGKDRPGMVRPNCGPFRRTDRTQLAATITIDSDPAGNITVTVEPPDSGPESSGQPFRPTTLMEKVSMALEAAGGPLSFRKVKDAVSGKDDYIRAAIRVLMAEGFVTADTGGNTSVRPYRQGTDPLSDQHSGTGHTQPSKMAVSVSRPYNGDTGHTPLPCPGHTRDTPGHTQGKGQPEAVEDDAEPPPKPIPGAPVCTIDDCSQDLWSPASIARGICEKRDLVHTIARGAAVTV